MSSQKVLLLLPAVALLLAACSSLPKPRLPLPLVEASAVCTDAELPIYFAEGSAELTAPAKAVIADAGAKAKHCNVLEVQIEGLADYRGEASANLTLSRQRAERVAQTLEKAGLPGPRFAVVAEGEAGAITASGAAEPLRREVKVLIRFKR